jgi:hypothetical protein
MKLSKILLLLLTASSASLALAGGGSNIIPEAFNGGEIKTQELMIGLQYKF